MLADGKVVIDLIDAIKPGSINYDLVLHGGNEQVRYLLNKLLSWRRRGEKPKNVKIAKWVTNNKYIGLLIIL